MYSLGNSWAGRKCPISGGAKRCQTARESIPPQNPGSGGQGFGVGIDLGPASEVGQKLKFNTDPKVDNSNMCDTGNGEKRKKRKPLSRESTIIVDLSMKKPSRTETFPHVEI